MRMEVALATGIITQTLYTIHDKQMPWQLLLGLAIWVIIAKFEDSK
jgi:hypothetical protein